MTEKEKMLAGLPYDCGDPELMELWYRGKNLARRYNLLDYANKTEQMDILDELLGSHGPNIQITAPFYVDYGKFIFIGNNCEINMNCVFLDCNRINIGNNVLIAPGVHIYTVFHPIKANERFPELLESIRTPEYGSQVQPAGQTEQAKQAEQAQQASAGSQYAVGKTAPVTIGNNVWIGGGSIILPGVSIGDNVTIGAGSVVTKSISNNTLAYGNPCRVIKEI